jgi:hypothetical protein
VSLNVGSFVEWVFEGAPKATEIDAAAQPTPSARGAKRRVVPAQNERDRRMEKLTGKRRERHGQTSVS